ncbi:Acetyl esterase [Paraburkholderia domus]|jgi:acetyl esterase|uniref:alpha/beta hydrolase n=1 Tax=Paraburkholderia domus TaxID=2793075 RepID=UPI00191222E4|nr:alpha/beta hydrolase [Paraburkholderia domus]MBK5062524.1 alpha/beta hydrolase [Burkholderia sp. R-70199]MBK5088688.1 alpha/beta hydrolase [Burkholderia sp. R-69927]MBK5118809.1 alpha/beta hydrolase [Burkholderia sp. R-69980]MBK5181658.1 alpha/beta hydrolase [Burkholderia sp. R-69749]MCI0144829.1 alpha/beta hydrolase fold domain-containing protein [Paraburkholderia sediminicola]
MLEPEIAAFIERTAAIYSGHSTSLPPSEQRAIYDRYAAALTPPLPAGVTAEDAMFQASAGHPIRLRLYRNRSKASGTHGGTVLYFHGGGFVLGSLESHQIVTARIAADTGLDVIAVDYRLAPEHRAPAAHDDCLEVTLAALDDRLPFDSLAKSALQLAGDSAGANLAASIAMRLRDGGVQGVRGLALVYPMLGTEPQMPARETEAHAPMLTLADVHAFRDLYWGERAPYPAWTVPLDAARFDRLPPTLAIGVEHDPLRDDARVFVERVNAAGGQARLWIGTGLVHGCWRALESSPGVKALHHTVCQFLGAHSAVS